MDKQYEHEKLKKELRNVFKIGIANGSIKHGSKAWEEHPEEALSEKEVNKISNLTVQSNDENL